MALYEEFTVNQGEDFLLTIELVNKDGSVKNLTGYGVRAKAKRSYDQTDQDAFNFSYTTDAPKGIINLFLTNEQTGMMQCRYYFDVEIFVPNTDGNDLVERVLEGLLLINLSATRSNATAIIQQIKFIATESGYIGNRISICIEDDDSLEARYPISTEVSDEVIKSLPNVDQIINKNITIKFLVNTYDRNQLPDEDNQNLTNDINNGVVHVISDENDVVTITRVTRQDIVEYVNESNYLKPLVSSRVINGGDEYIVPNDTVFLINGS